MKLFCITNHSPVQVQAFLDKTDEIKPGRIHIHPVGSEIEKAPTKPYLFLLNITDFLRNQDTLNSKKYTNTIVFLFTSPFRAIELTNATLLDVEQHERHTYKYVFRSLQKANYVRGLKRETDKVERSEDFYLYKIVEDVKYGSLLTPLMTFIYTLPKSTHQTPVKEAVVNYLFGKKGKITKYLAKKQVELGPKSLAKLEDILSSEPGQAYKKALEYQRVHPDKSTKILEKKFDVKSYELKYLRKILASQKFYKQTRGKTTRELSKA